MGEFGVIATADAASRQKWTDFVARAAERLNISWFYWEYCSEFGVYNCKLDTWNADLLQALIPK